MRMKTVARARSGLPMWEAGARRFVVGMKAHNGADQRVSGAFNSRLGPTVRGGAV